MTKAAAFLHRCGLFVLGTLFSLTAWAAGNTPAMRHTNKPLRIYFIDVEGGQSTLFVTPEGKSLLVDTGWPGNNGRDAERIVAAAHAAGVHKIDYVLITHFHEDHVGGVPNLVARIPVRTFIDHGVNRQTDDKPTETDYLAYRKVLATGKYRHILAHPGMVLHIGSLRDEIVSADGALIQQALPGAGQNNATACKASAPRPADQTENARSVGSVLTFGRVRILDLGDLTWDKEMQLMCPVNKLGHFNLYVVSHHGWMQSGSPALVHGIRAPLAIMDNGEHKGGTPSTWSIIESAPGLRQLWQLHTSAEGGATHNVPAPYIANIQGGSDGNYLRVTVWPSGVVRVFNSRTQRGQSYRTGAQ